MGKLRRDAIFSSGTEPFVSPLEPDAGEEVTLRCRVAKDDVDAVFLMHEETSVEMQIDFSDELFDYYGVRIRLSEEPFSYYFQIKKEDITIYFNKQGDVGCRIPNFPIAFYRVFIRRIGQRVQ